MECTVTTIGYITSRVDIIWSRDNVELKRTKDVNISYINNDTAVYVNYFNVSQVSTNDDDKVYGCKIIINQEPPLIAIGTTTLKVNGKIRHIY